jgi:DNA-directed RNA polymerase specialized sigma24 family protein
VHQPNNQLLAAANNRKPTPICQSEGYGKADLADIATGLRAMVKGNLPEAKPAAPVVVGEVLPQSGPRDYVARRAAQLKGSTFLKLARCEEQAWAELQWAASNNQVWSNGRILKGMPAVDSIQHFSSSLEEDPEELGLFGSTESTVLDQLAAEEETAWRVEAIMTALSDREWTALQMKAEGLPDAAIAESIGATMPTTWKVIRQARAKAKAVLA